MAALTIFQQKSDRKGKENIIEIHDSKESDSETEKKQKKQSKCSKVCVCTYCLAFTLRPLLLDPECEADPAWQQGDERPDRLAEGEVEVSYT